MRKYITVLLVMFLCGCSGAQIRQEFIGLSVSDVKNSKTRQTQQYDISSVECINKIKEVLSEMQAIVREDKKNQFIVADNFQEAFRSSINTTQVGIIVTSWETNKSQVDVASGNSDLAVFVSKKISERIKPVKESQPREAQVIK